MYVFGQGRGIYPGGGDDERFSAHPVLIAGLLRIVSVAANDHGILAVSAAGEVWVWGNDTEGLSGTGDENDRVFAPFRLTGLPKIRSVSAGEGGALALSTDGRVFSWGTGANGQGRYANVSPVGQVKGLPPVITISCGGTTSMALTRDGTVWQWGSDEVGGLGDGQTRSPGRVAVIAEKAPFPRARAICAQRYGGWLVTMDHELYGWGEGIFGTCGDGRLDDHGVTRPHRLTTPGPVRWVAGSADAVIAGGEDRLVCWGTAREAIQGRIAEPDDPAGFSYPMGQVKQATVCYRGGLILT